MLRRTCVHADNHFVKSSGKGNVKVSTLVPHLPSSNAIFYESNLQRAEMAAANGGSYDVNKMDKNQRMSPPDFDKA